MASERRRANHAQKVSYAYAVGSSLDPDMEGFEEYEQHFAGGGPSLREMSPPPDIYFDDDIEAAIHLHMPSDPDARTPEESWSEPQDIDIEMPFSSPPPSPTPNIQSLPPKQAPSFVDMLLAANCPFCHAPFSLYLEMGQAATTCAVCTSSFRLGDTPNTWAHVHSTPSP